jgi:hypothetical protein
MEQMQLKKATKKVVKLKIGMSGASGFGKTYSALLLAYGITSDWSKIAVIDTENGSADLYSDLGEYNSITLESPFTPERYIFAIDVCEKAGIECVIVDSITHEWSGKGGCLDIHNQLGGKFQDWAKVTPRHNAFIQAILQSKMHIITTVRRKQDYDLSTSSSGKAQVTKVGTKEETREGFEYELTLNFELVNDNHLAKASKDRTGLFMNKPEFIITSETGKQLLAWANSGVDEVKYLIQSLDAATNRNDLVNLWNANNHLQSNNELVAKFKELGSKFKTEAQ